VAGLNGYTLNWRLVARVTKKGSVRQFRFKTKEGDGQLFSVDLLDREGGETRGTFFGDAVDTFYGVLQEGGVYVFGGGKVKKGDRRYCSFEHEIAFDEGCTVQPAEDEGTFPHQTYDFRPLAGLADVSLGAVVDVVAVAAEVEQPVDVVLRAGGTKRRLNVTLLDDSGATCRLTVWGEQADMPFREGAIVLLKAAKVSDYGGRSLNTSFSSSLAVGDDARGLHARAAGIEEWYVARGAVAFQSAKALSSDRNSGPAVTLAEVKAVGAELEAALAPGGDVAALAAASAVRFHTVVPATVTFLPQDRPPFYMACPVQVSDDRAGEGRIRSCNRKVEQRGEGEWTCIGGHTSSEPVARWMASFSIADHTATQFVSVFDEVGCQLLGCEATEAVRLWPAMEAGDRDAEARIDRIFQGLQLKRWRMRVKSRREVWNDEARVKVSVVDCVPLPPVADGCAKLVGVLPGFVAEPSASVVAVSAGA